MKVRWLPAAAESRRRQVEYIGGRNPRAALDAGDRIRAAIRLLGQYPAIDDPGAGTGRANSSCPAHTFSSSTASKPTRSPSCACSTARRTGPPCRDGAHDHPRPRPRPARHAAGGEAEARAFYAGLLGLPERDKPEALRARGGCWFERGDVRVHLGVEDGFVPARKAHPAFRVDDLAALAPLLAAAGHPSRADVPLDGCDRLFVADPFGNRIELLQARP